MIRLYLQKLEPKGTEKEEANVWSLDANKIHTQRKWTFSNEKRNYQNLDIYVKVTYEHTHYLHCKKDVFNLEKYNIPMNENI